MPIVGGLDIHRKQITFDYLDTATGEVRRGQIAPADRAHLRAWLARFAGRDDAAFALPFDEEFSQLSVLDHGDADLGTLGVHHQTVLHVELCKSLRTLRSAATSMSQTGLVRKRVVELR